jgi:hypothetical protein
VRDTALFARTNSHHGLNNKTGDGTAIFMHNPGLIRASAACVVLALSHLACAADLHLPREERASAWFAPMLVTSNASMCGAALEAERDTFFNPLDDDPKVSGLTGLATQNSVVEDPDVVVLAEYPTELTLTLPDRSRAFLFFFAYPGCGGGCERAAVGIDDERIVEGKFEEATRESFKLPRALPLTYRYGPDRWRLFKSSSGDFYLRGTLHDHTQWYRVAAADRFELACDIALKPDIRSGKAAVYSQELSDAIDSLRVAADRMAGHPGDCGSMHTPGRWAQYREKNLETALYRPWAVVERHQFESNNSGGDYARIVQQLQLWSLGGVKEYRDFGAYQSQFSRAAAILTSFYRARFGWTPERAAETAEAALEGAISSGFGFYEYEPYPGQGERQLRDAILSRAPLEKIRGMAVDPKGIDRAGEDSILNLAIEYPEALSYLLDKGFDPNIGNGFGKTPLMYAAQYNQLASAELLLRAGADPNATTYLSSDRCAYTINTSHWTPLHYAARYSSARLIKLLREHGAVTFIQSTSYQGNEYPLDRLQRYAGFGVTEDRNPHIAESEFLGLAVLLAVPSDEEKLAMATDQIARARWDYAAGDAQRAYQRLRLALFAQPDQPDAIADLPLIALRAGNIGPAISAADRAITTLKTPAALAAAWFNKGLICEHPQAREVFTLDRARCELDTLEPFVNSWKAQPSPARANKLRTLIQKSAASCRAESGRHYRVALVDPYGSFRVYVLHRSSETIDGSQIRWSIPGVKVVDRFSLGEDAMTLLEVPLGGNVAAPTQLEIVIEGKECAPQW